MGYDYYAKECERCGSDVFFMRPETPPYPEYDQDRAILAEVVRMNADKQCTLYDVLPAACLTHLTRLANNGQTQPGPRGCAEEVTG